MAEMLATSCVTSGVPMLFIVVLSIGACEPHNSAKRTSQADRAAAAPLVHDTRSCRLVSSRLSLCPPRAFPLWRKQYELRYEIYATQQTYGRNGANRAILAPHQRMQQARRSSGT